MLRKLGLCFGALLLSLLTACTGKPVERKVVYENSVYHWRIEHVIVRNFPASSHQYFEVFLGDRPLVLPAAAFNDQRDIGQFIAAGGFDVGHWRNKSIVVAFENVQKREGQEVRLIRSVMITPDFSEGDVVLTDMYTQQEVVVQRVEPGDRSAAD